MRIDLTEELPGHLQLNESADVDMWPAMTIELEVRSWTKADPSVGIFQGSPDDVRFYGQITVTKRDGVRVPIAFDDEAAFARHVWAWIAADVHEDAEDIADMINSRVGNALEDMKP